MTSVPRCTVLATRLLFPALLLTLAACGTEAVTHDVRVTFDDPTRRLGPPPWSVGVGRPSTDGVGVGGAAPASPESPFRATFTEVRGVRGLTARSNMQEVGFAIPALADGWWHGIVLVGDDGASEGYARFARRGEQPAPDAEVLFLRGTARPNPNGNGWQFDLVIQIPAALMPEATAAQRLRRLNRIVPPETSCSFGVEGQPTVRLPHDARVVVLVEDESKGQAMIRAWMEALLRSGGCALIDPTRIDSVVRDQLERNIQSASAMKQVSKSGATMVLLSSDATEMVQLVDVATMEVVGTWSLR